MTRSEEATTSREVAVLGGGMGGLAAAWRLSAPGSGFTVTVYQRDHLLGGKGASSRNADAAYGHRIEEHGIHILMGWYESMVGLMREVYGSIEGETFGELGAPIPFEELLIPHDGATMAETPETTGHGWRWWTVQFPRRPGTPGVDTTPSVAELIHRTARWLTWLGARLEQLEEGLSFGDPLGVDIDRDASHHEMAEHDHAIDPSESAAFLEMLHAGEAERVLEEAMAAVESHFAEKGGVEGIEDTVRRILTGMWLAKAVIVGMVRAGIRTRRDFARLDDMEFRDWLNQSGGASWLPETMRTKSAPVEILYDLAFGHDKDFAAGVWGYAMLLFAFGYRGSYVYKMNGGMGDVIFAPLYLALKKRGVKFRFLHDVTNVAAEDGVVEAITFDDLGGLPDDYQPLFGITANGRTVPCWPHAPTQPLKPKGPFTLKRGEGFDDVVLAIGVAGLLPSCQPLVDASPRFSKMLETAGTVGTQCAQLWFDKPVRDMGWPGDALIACFTRPFNSNVIMEQTLPWEPWPDPRPQEVVYLCDQAPDGLDNPQVFEELEKYVAGLKILMPSFTEADFHDPEGRAGVERLKAQYWRANTVGSDRYVITPPGSPKHRLTPGGSEFANLVLAGDWVATDIDAGCVEAAARAGLEAGRVLAARPPTVGPRYLDTPIDWVRPNPFAFRGAKMWLVPLLADRAKLAALCERLYGGPSGHAIEPLFGGVLLVFASVAEGRSVPERDDGFLSEEECVAFVPVTMKGGPFSIGCAAPLAYVNDPAAVVAGREVYGFPKFPAEVAITSSPSLHAEVSVLSLEERAPNDHAVPRPAITLRHTGPLSSVALPAGPKGIARALEHALGALGDGAFGDDAFGEGSLDGILDPSIPLVFLRQLRDAAQPYRAAYREVLTARAHVEHLRGGRVHFGPFEVSIPRRYRPNIPDFLGVAETHHVGLVVEVDLDFGFGLGTPLTP